MLSDYTVQSSPPLPVNAVVLLYIKRHLDVGVLVTETGQVGHLFFSQLQELIPFIILYLHHVKDALNFLQEKQINLNILIQKRRENGGEIQKTDRKRKE